MLASDETYIFQINPKEITKHSWSSDFLASSPIEQTPISWLEIQINQKVNKTNNTCFYLFMEIYFIVHYPLWIHILLLWLIISCSSSHWCLIIFRDLREFVCLFFCSSSKASICFRQSGFMVLFLFSHSATILFQIWSKCGTFKVFS